MDTFWGDAPPAVTRWWKGAGVLGTQDLLHFLNVKEKRGMVKPLELLWQVISPKQSKSAGSSISPPAGNGCVFKCLLRNCDQIPQRCSLENAFRHHKYNATWYFPSKPSGGLSVMKLFQKSSFTLNSCLILIQINFCVQTSPKGLTQGALK